MTDLLFPLACYIAAILTWSASVFVLRKGEASGWCALVAYPLTAGPAVSELTRAAAGPPYWPNWVFWTGAALFTAMSAWQSHSVFQDADRWRRDDEGLRFPFGRSALAALIAIPGLALWLQYAYTGRQIAWHWPVLAWAVGIYVLLRQFYSWPSRDSDSSSWMNRPAMAPFSTGSVGEDEDDDEPGESLLDPPLSWQRMALTGLLLFAAFLYLVNPSEYPTDVHGDEGEVSLFSIHYRDAGQWNPFMPAWFKIPAFFFMVPGFGMWAFGDDLAGVRTVAGLIGMANVWLAFLAARRLLRPGPALLAAFLFLICCTTIHYSRVGIGYIQAVFFYLAAFYALLRGVQDRSLAGFAWAGLAVAIGWLSYQSCKLLPLLVIASLLGLLILRRSQSKRWLYGGLVFALAFWTGWAPMLGSYVRDPGAATYRLKQVMTVSEDAQLLGQRVDHFGSLARTAMAPVAMPDASPFYTNNNAGGIFAPASAFFFVAGAALLWFRILTPGGFLLWLWIGATLVIGSALTIKAPAYQRILGVLPLMAIMAAVPLGAALRHIARAWNWGLAPRVILAVIVAAGLAVESGHRYFNVIMSAPQMHEDSTRVARFIDEIGPHTYVYFFGLPHYSFKYGNIRFIAQDTPGEDVVDKDKFLEKVVKRRGPVCFILIRSNRIYLDALRELYPGGREITHRDIKGTELFISYQVDL